MQVYLVKLPDIPKEMNAGKDMMGGGVCIIDGRSVLVFMGLGEEEAVGLFSESEGFIRFFVRYYNLIFDRVKKTA
jgi:hypothetical protein